MLKLYECSRFSYDPTLKEQVIKTSLEKEPSDILLRREVGAIACGAASPDYFEYMSPDLLCRIAKQYRATLDGVKPSELPTTSNSSLRHEIFSRFFDTFSSTAAANDERTANIMRSYRKVLGFAQGVEELQKASDMIIQASELGFLEQEDVMLYTGTFNPFPHRGHIEVARTAIAHAYGLGIKNPRLIVSTFGINHWKPEANETFAARLDQIHNGFFYEDRVSIADICGDTNESRSFEQQSLLVAAAGLKRMRYVVGSDIFIADANMAREGHPFALPFFTNDVEFYISHRPQDNRDSLEEACDIAMSFGRKTSLLPQPSYNLSGTKVRSLDADDILDQAPNHLVREYASRQA